MKYAWRSPTIKISPTIRRLIFVAAFLFAAHHISGRADETVQSIRCLADLGVVATMQKFLIQVTQGIVSVIQFFQAQTRFTRLIFLDTNLDDTATGGLQQLRTFLRLFCIVKRQGRQDQQSMTGFRRDVMRQTVNHRFSKEILSGDLFQSFTLNWHRFQ